MTMTENEFYQKALLMIASNSAFGNGHSNYRINRNEWAREIRDAAEALTDIALKNSHFDNDYEPP